MEKSKKSTAFLTLIFALFGFAILFINVLTYKVASGESTVKLDLHFYELFTIIPDAIWCPILIIIFALIGAILPLIATKINKGSEILCITSTILFLILFCFLIAFPQIFSFYGSKYIVNFKSASLGYGSAIAMLLFVLSSICSLMTSNIRYGDNVRGITEDGILVALAFVLNFVKIPTGPSGSINLQMLPLFIIALRRGPVHGFISGGFVFGFMTCLTDGYGFATFPFDYLIGFGSCAIVGFFRKIIFNSKLLKGELFLLIATLIATLVRFIGGVTSSMVIYSYDFVASLSYNATYIPLSGAVSAIGVMLLLPIIKILNKRYPTN